MRLASIALLIFSSLALANPHTADVCEFLPSNWQELKQDDTQAIQEAVNSLLPLGGEVRLCGRHRVDGTVYIDSPNTYRIVGTGGGQGSSSALYVSGTGPALQVGRSDKTWFSGVHIIGVRIYGNPAVAGAVGVKILRVNHNHIESSTIENFSGIGSVGLLVDGSGDASVTSIFLNSKLRNNETGARLISTTSWRFEGGFILGNSAYGIQQIRGDTIDISGANFDRNGVAVEVAGIGPRIMGGRFEHNQVGLRVTGRNSVIFGNVFNQSGLSGSVAIDLAAGSSRNKLALNQFVDVPASGWKVRDAGAGNTVIDP